MPDARSKSDQLQTGTDRGVSIVVCCHDSAKRLPETLPRLAAQRVPAEIPWEVVIVDNASKDKTAETATRLWPADAPAPLRVVAEPRLGLGNARVRSFSEARYEIISYLDDDNWVEGDWVANLVDFFDQHPDAAAIGGPSTAVFEGEAPPWFSTLAGFFAVGPQHPEFADITDQCGTLLWGAGLSLRKSTAQKLMREGFEFLSNGGCLPIRRGDDTELCFALRALGGRLYYDPRMAIRHVMPTDRMVWPKALELLHIMGETSPLLDLYLIVLRRPPYATYPAWKKTWLFQFLKTLFNLFKQLIRHPSECLRQPEGSMSAVRFVMLTGHAAMLLKLSGTYRAIGQRIARAPWARATK
jgi:glycosyltransferase involved in cell wall biosynthesis